MSTYYDEYRNTFYNPDDVEENPGDNQNWKMIQKGFNTLQARTTLAVTRAILPTGDTLAAGEEIIASANLPDADTIAAFPPGPFRFVVSLTTPFESIIPVTNLYLKYTAPNNTVYFKYGSCSKGELQIDGAKFYIRLRNISDEPVTFTTGQIKVAYYLYQI